MGWAEALVASVGIITAGLFLGRFAYLAAGR